MRILILGGTRFLSRAVAAEAVAREHDVTCAARGVSGAVPEGALLVHLDRAEPDWSELDGDWDAVVDVARTPSWVRTALDELADRTAHWTFVSTVSVYGDHLRQGGNEQDTPLLEPITDDVVQDSAEKYGGSKVACEQLVLERAERAFVPRPGLIVGPGDPSGRFSYWPERLANDDEVLAPGSPDQPTQIVDARDLAGWIVDAIENDLTGVFDAVGPATPLGDLLAEVATGVGHRPRLTWVPDDFLLEHGVEPWSGPRSLPLWLPGDEAGTTARDTSAAIAAGLQCRPVADTAKDTLDWLHPQIDGPRTGLTREQEQEVLQAWHSLHG